MIYLFHERHVTLIFDANKSNSLVFSERDSGFKMPINPIFCSFQKGIRDSKCFSWKRGNYNNYFNRKKKRKKKKRNESELKQITGTRFKNVSLVVLFPLTLLTLRIFMVYSVSAVMVQ